MPAAVPRAGDVALLVLEALSIGEPAPGQLQLLRGALARWPGLAEPEGLEAAVTSWHGPSAGAADQRALELWFGAVAVQEADADEGGPARLVAFARDHGPKAAVRLLGLACEVAAAAGGIDGSALHRLERAAHHLGADPVVVAALVRRADPRYVTGLRLPLRGDRVVVGSGPACDLVLPDPQVLPRHAELVRVDGGWRIASASSSRPVLVDGRPVSSAPLEDGQFADLGPVRLRRVGDQLEVSSRRRFSALEARGLRRRIASTEVLGGVSFTLVSGEVVAVVGPSGGGKTTLVSALLGTAPADEGRVELDGVDLHALLEEDATIAGSVPQDDLVLPELSVEETLTASAQLRFGGSPDSVQEDVDRVIGELDLGRIRQQRIGDALERGISGGQRKRVNLGQELLGRSRVLFMDEPTNGLDPLAAQDIVQLLRRLADQGRIVALVTHDLTPAVIQQVDHLLVLARGGRVAWFGPPSEACAWFGVPTPDALFHRLADRTPEEWAEAYRSSEAHTLYVETRAAAVALGLLGGAEGGPEAPSPRSRPGDQFSTLVARYLRCKVRDRAGLGVLAAQPPALAAGMVVVYPGVATGTVFVLTLSCLWFGLFAAVRELISDRLIWRRERRLGVGVLPYVGSKVSVLSVITALQSAAMVGLCWAGIDFGANGFSFPLLVVVCTLTSWAGMGLGLLVGAAWTRSEAAVGTLPILLVPQILFSSILVSLRNMDPLSQGLSWLTIQRYALDAALKCGTHLEQASRSSTQWERRSVTGALQLLGLKPDDENDLGLPLWLLSTSLAGWAVLFLAFATVVVALRDRRGA